MNGRILGEALFLAVKNKKKAQVKKLLSDPKIDINWQCPETGNTALHCAAENDEYELALLLLDKDADAEIKNEKLLTPINSAVAAGFWNFVIRFAKRRKASGADAYGKALWYAAYYNKYDAVMALLEAGSSTTWINSESKQTALHCAASHNNPEMIRGLRRYSANPSALDVNNKTPVDIATAYAKQSSENYAAVLAFAEDSVPPIKTRPSIEDLEDVISTVSTRAYKPYYLRQD